MATYNEEDHFARLVEALDPWLGQLVIIGGWAHRLYRLHPTAGTPEYEPLGTLDADVALPPDVADTEANIRDRLLANEFREELIGEFRPPVAQYFVTTDESGFFAEFLTPLRGGGIRRDGERDATMRIAGVSVQKLRHLELLLRSPWSVVIQPENGFAVSHPRTIRIPNPAAFMVQKVLIHRDRELQDRAKDLLYIHDTFETFAANLPAIANDWQTNVKPFLTPKAITPIETAGETLFGEVNDTIRDAAEMASGRSVSPERLLELCRYGWKEAFLS